MSPLVRAPILVGILMWPLSLGAQPGHLEVPPEPAATPPAAPPDESTPAESILAKTTAVPEAPPPLPRKKGVVLESNLGVLGFLGHFRNLAPPAYYSRVQLGYEFLNWLMLFGEGELSLTDTSVGQDPTKARAFPIFGFGVGARITAHFSERFAAYAQASLMGMKADVPTNALTILGFRDAESLSPAFVGRVGLEWYQVNRHFALGAAFGIRSASGFARSIGGGDTPLMLDGTASIRYTF